MRAHQEPTTTFGNRTRNVPALAGPDLPWLALTCPDSPCQPCRPRRRNAGRPASRIGNCVFHPGRTSPAND
ncbi:hypothetical protein HMPREF1979_02069 [Actinomyces johnsonii F0542]|uniref:Uncharacterized protein n=1 Tax=Actinomyces johnsonii F0542 TaxID=1321818 RepID=U1QLD0_9ACTO|nr:hypothetical protein HMPREF1979_02069 [Actinomyces johnsonii F0542]